MKRTLESIRTMFCVFAVTFVMIAIFSEKVFARNVSISFMCGGMTEQRYLHNNKRSTTDLSHLGQGKYQKCILTYTDGRPYTNINFLSEGKCRYVCGEGFFTYKFDLPSVSSAHLDIDIGGNYLIEASGDGKNWHSIVASKEESQHLERIDALKRLDLTRFVAAGVMYLRFSKPSNVQADLGACLFALSLTYKQPDRDVPLAFERKISEPPLIDGDLSDVCWKEAQPLSNFYAGGYYGSKEGYFYGRAVDQSVGRLCYDNENLYVSVKCFDKEPGKIAIIKSDDNENTGLTHASDLVSLSISSSDTANPCYEFTVTAKGTKRDAKDGDFLGYDPRWQAAARIVEDGWIMEVAIPFSQLGVSAPAKGDLWHLNINRIGGSNGEFSYWCYGYNYGFFQTKRAGRLIFGGQEQLPYLEVTDFAKLRQGQNELKFKFVAGQDGKKPCKLSIQDYPTEGVGWEKTLKIGHAESFVAPVSIDHAGDGTLIATLSDDKTRDVYQRLIFPYHITHPEPILTVIPEQSWYTSEEEAAVHIKVNLGPEEMKGAKLNVNMWRGPVGYQKKGGKTIAAQSFARVEFPLLENFTPSPLSTFEVELVSKDNKLLARKTANFQRQARGVNPTVFTIKDKITYKNGKPFLPMGFLITIGAEKPIAQAGYNFAQIYGTSDDEIQAYLDQGLANGVMLAIGVGLPLRNSFEEKKFTRLREIVSRFKNHPALFCWYLSDEPEAHNIPPAVTEKAYKIIKEIDPWHPIFLICFKPSIMEAYVNSCDAIAFDHYPIVTPELSAPLESIADYARIAAQAAGKKPVWACLQAYSQRQLSQGTGRLPNFDEVRNMMYLSLVRGVTGIMWFGYNTAHITPGAYGVVPGEGSIWEEIRMLGNELNTIKPMLLEGRNPENILIKCDNPKIHILTREYQDRIYIFAVNPFKEQLSADFSFTPEGPVGTTKLEVLFESRIVIGKDSTFADTFGPYAVHIYILPK